MLRPIPHVHIVIRCPGRDEVRILRLIPSLVNFAGVNNLLNDRELNRLFRCAVSAQLFRAWIVVCKSGCRWFRQLDLCNLDVIFRVAGGVSAEEEAMGAKGFAWDVLNVGHPLGSEGRPFECATVGSDQLANGVLGENAAIPIHDIIQKDRVLFPYLILFVDHLVM